MGPWPVASVLMLPAFLPTVVGEWLGSGGYYPKPNCRRSGQRPASLATIQNSEDRSHDGHTETFRCAVWSNSRSDPYHPGSAFRHVSSYAQYSGRLGLLDSIDCVAGRCPLPIYKPLAE